MLAGHTRLECAVPAPQRREDDAIAAELRSRVFARILRARRSDREEGVPVALELREDPSLMPAALVREERKGDAPGAAALRVGDLELRPGRALAVRMRAPADESDRAKER